MAEIMKEKAGVKNDHEEKEGREAPGVAAKGFSKWKAVLGATALAVGISVAQQGCSSDNATTNIEIPSADGGCTTDADGGDAACNPDGGPADAGPDSTADGGEGGMDAGHDGGEGGMDAGPTDGGMDGGVTDGGSDGGVVDGGDGGVVVDGGSDAGAACATATTGSFSGLISTTHDAEVGHYLFHFDGVSGSDALIDISCGGIIDGSAVHCPIGSTTVVDVPADGKQISINVQSATATYATVSITVANH